MTIREFLKYAKKNLNCLQISELKYELKVLLEDCLNMNTEALILNKDEEIDSSKLVYLFQAVEMRKQGFPLQYILGSWEFMGIKIKVGSGVLIPRDDTRVLVEDISQAMVNKRDLKIIDLCTGSGCIAFALEKLLGNNAKIYAVEASEGAYKYFCENFKNLNSQVCGVQENIFESYSKFEDNFFDVVVSNPPYIKTNQIKNLQKEVQYEPTIALDGGEDGLYFYRNICKLWISKIKPGGYLAFEIGEGQFQEVKSIMLHSGISNIQFKKDINGIIRVVTGIKIAETPKINDL